METTMKVIMLSGPANCGKTTTINGVYEKLKKDFEKEIFPRKGLGAITSSDFEGVWVYKGKRIAFFSMGDYSMELTDAMENYENECDILVCACNNVFKKPYRKVIKYPHKIIEKSIGNNPGEYERCNLKDRDEIIEEIHLSITEP